MAIIKKKKQFKNNPIDVYERLDELMSKMASDKIYIEYLRQRERV